MANTQEEALCREANAFCTCGRKEDAKTILSLVDPSVREEPRFKKAWKRANRPDRKAFMRAGRFADVVWRWMGFPLFIAGCVIVSLIFVDFVLV